jgi:centromeric protein E
VFESLAVTIVEKSLTGYNGTVFAYGQTSSGKTHTLMGNPATNPGITWMAVDYVFSKIRETTDTEFLVRLSYLEIYNEEIKVRRRPTWSSLERPSAWSGWGEVEETQCSPDALCLRRTC